MAGSRPNPTPVVLLFPAHRVFTGLSFSSNKPHAGWPCHCGNEIVQDFPRSFITYLPGSAAPRRSEPVSFLRIEPAASPMYAWNPLFNLGALFPEKSAWRLKFISWISHRF